MALIAEAAELVEHFQWLTEDAERATLPAGTRAKVADELADVLRLPRPHRRPARHRPARGDRAQARRTTRPSTRGEGPRQPAEVQRLLTAGAASRLRQTRAAHAACTSPATPPNPAV